MDGADPTNNNTYIHPHTIMVPQGDADHALIRGTDRAQFHPGMELAQRAAGDLHGAALHVGGAGEDGLALCVDRAGQGVRRRRLIGDWDGRVRSPPRDPGPSPAVCVCTVLKPNHKRTSAIMPFRMVVSPISRVKAS